MERKDFTPHPWQAPMLEHISEHDRCALWAGMGTGKAQPVSEPVATPQGWAPIGSVRLGDYVIGSDGRPTKVIGVFPQGLRKIFRVEFNDGSWTRTDAEHLWYVVSPKQRNRSRPGVVMTTERMANAGLVDSCGNRKWSIPQCDPVVYDEKAVGIEPYMLGVLLGDGCFRHRPISVTSDVDIIGAWPGRRTEHPSDGICNVRLSGTDITQKLRALNLFGCYSWEKHVPPEYMLGSEQQRLALLQGLLDTDGSPMQDGGVEFSSTSERLADAVVELTQSLGGVARKSGPRTTRHQNGIGRESWRVNVKLSNGMKPFRLARKLSKWIPPTKYPARRMVSAIRNDGEEEAVCIRVAAEDSLYLTRGYIVTHNTAPTLTLLDALYLGGETHPTLILGPLRVARKVWSDEVRKWNHLSGLAVVPIIGDEKTRLAAIRHDAPVYTTNYDNLVWLIEYWGDKWPYRTVIADESDYIKGHRISFRTSSKGKEFLAGQGAKRAGALARIAHTHIRRFIELTGTPSPNGLVDLWGQLWYLDRGQRLGRTFDAFRQRWFEKSYDGYGSIARAHAHDEIHAAVRDLCLTIDGKDWFDLAKPIVNNVYVDLPPKARRLYRDMEREMFVQIEQHSAEAFNAAARTQKCLQLANGAVYVDPDADSDAHPRAKKWAHVHDEKLDALESIVHETGGTPLLVCYEFKSDLARLLKAFPKGRALATEADEDDFKAGKIPLLFLHPKSGGHGIDGFQYACNNIVFFGHNWSLGQYQQVIERIGPVRQMQAGFERPVFLHHIIARDTVDELVMERRETKREVQDLLLEACKRKH